MSRSLTATVLMALMALSPGIPALAQQEWWKRSKDDILLCYGQPVDPASLPGFEVCLSARRHPDEQSRLVGLYFVPYSDYVFCFVGTEKPNSSEWTLVGRSGEFVFGLDRPLAPSELEGETPWIIQRKARILEVEGDPVASFRQLVVYDETELDLKGFAIVSAPPGHFGDSILPEVFLERPECQAILN
ncbi:hypothetical protein [Thermostichus sp. MS-CIW-37]